MNHACEMFLDVVGVRCKLFSSSAPPTHHAKSFRRSSVHGLKVSLFVQQNNTKKTLAKRKKLIETDVPLSTPPPLFSCCLTDLL